jgi:hypothetical protein
MLLSQSMEGDAYDIITSLVFGGEAPWIELEIKQARHANKVRFKPTEQAMPDCMG